MDLKKLFGLGKDPIYNWKTKYIAVKQLGEWVD